MIIGLIVGFIITSYESFQKYWEGRTSFSEYLVESKIPQPLPTFSICTEPAFNRDYMEKDLKLSPNLFLYSNVLDFGITNFPKNLSSNGSNYTLESLWNETIIKPNMFSINTSRVVDDRLVIDNDDIEIFEPINSLWYGRCSSVVLKRPSLPNHHKLLLIIGFMDALVFLPYLC